MMEEISNDKEVLLKQYKQYLNNIIGEDLTNSLIKELVGDDKIKNATFGMTKDSGCAYDGSFLYNVIRLCFICCKLNDILPEENRLNKKTIFKVVLLQHISKVNMFIKNDNEWEVSKRGILYKFSDEKDVCIKGGEKSILILNNVGVKIDKNEFEALRIIDKTKENDNNIIAYSGILSTIIRIGNEILSLINRKNNDR